MQIQTGLDKGMAEHDGTRALHADGTPNAHILVGRPGIPVHEADVRVARLCGKHLHRECVVLASLLRDVYLVGTERSPHCIA